MEIATLICNKKLNYDIVLQVYSMYEYLRKQGNQVQVIDYNFVSGKVDKKSRMLYDFLSNNMILTANRYKTIEQLEENQPLVDKYIVLNGNYNDLNIRMNVKDNIAYGIKEASNLDIDKLSENYSRISTLFDCDNKNVKRVADPIFLLSKEEWYDRIQSKSNISDKEDYLLIYGETVTKEMLNYALNVAQRNNYKVYIVADKVESFLYKGKLLKNVSPIDLAGLISNAHDVITSCSDGIKLSVLFDKNIHIFPSEQNEQLRLINDLNLEKRIVDNPDRYLRSSKDYEYSNNYINELKENSFEILKL